MNGSDRLIRRVNRLFHEYTQDSFDAEHLCRHRVERAFWETVAPTALACARRTVPSGGPLPCPRAHPRPLVVGEVGCGTGFVTAVTAALLKPGDRLVAMDACEGALESTSGKWRALPLPAGLRLERVAADAQALPLAAGSVDVMVVNASLHHIPRPEAALNEIDRVLAPGGLFALGFEPNRGHFESALLHRLARGLDRVCWYASPRQNRRRLREWLSPQATPATTAQAAAAGCSWAGSINARLLDDGLIASPLGSHQILDLLDPHARGAGAKAGFDPAALIARFFPGYDVLRLEFTDYLGESGRRLPLARAVADRLLGALVPGRGSLFSWLLRKPLAGLRAEANGADEAAEVRTAGER